MASNQVEAFRRARDAYDNARRSGASGKELNKLKAERDAAEANCPRGSTGWGILGRVPQAGDHRLTVRMSEGAFVPSGQ